LNSEKIYKIQKKIVKRYEKYERKVGWIVKWYGKYGRKVSWNVKWYGKYGRKVWNDMENMEESQVE
jgi:hypothetical protein